MTTIAIDPAVALAEADALIEHFRQRCLIQAQAIAELKARLAALQAPPAAAQPDTEEPANG